MSSIDFKRLSELIKWYLANGDIAKKYTCIDKYQKELFSNVGDIINYCHEIIEVNTELSFNDWCNNILVLSYDYYNYGKFDGYSDVFNDGDVTPSNVTYRAIWLISKHIKNISLYCMCESLFNDGLIGDGDRIPKDYVINTYLNTKDFYEYILCEKVHDYFNTHTHHDRLGLFFSIDKCYFGDYINAIKAVFLYVALKNEMAWIMQQAAIEGVELNGVENTPKKDLKGLVSVPNSTDGITIPQEAKKAIKSSLNVLTERAQKYFTLAIKQGFMEQTQDGHYKWLYGANRGKVRLGYFLQKIYSPNPKEKEPLPLKDLQALFNIERLDSAIYMREGAKKPQQWREAIDRLFED